MNKLLIISTVSTLLIFGSAFSQAPKYEGKKVYQIEFLGLKNQDAADLEAEIKTSKNYPLKGSEIRGDIKKLFEKGNFENITVEVEELNDGVKVRFICKERPVVREVVFRGNVEIYEQDLLVVVPIKDGEVLRKDLVEKSLLYIKKKYDSEGYFNSVIAYKIVPIKDEENVVRLIFLVDEGEEVKVRKISLFGPKKIYAKELLDLMDTSEDAVLKDGAFKREIYEQDKVKILNYYKENGYLDAQIVDESVDYEWVDLEAKEKRGIYITLKLTEGEKYYFDRYTVKVNLNPDGKTVFKPEDFLPNFTLRDEGEIFNNTLFMQDRQFISFKYATKGYIFARVVPNRTVTERVVKENGKEEKRKFVRIDFVIDEGSQAYVENIIIKGNKKTKDKVIRREVLIKEGELFDSSKMQLTREKIYNLGFFKQVNIDVRPGSREGYMNLIIDVEEQPSGTLSLGGGYGTNTGFSIFADIGENNLFGNGQRIGLRFEYGPLKNSITLSFNERWFMDYPVGFDASVFYYLYSINGGSIFPYSSELASYKKESFGYSLGFSYRFLLFYTSGIRWTQAFKTIVEPSGNSNDEVFKLKALGTQEKRTVSLYVFRNSKDNYLNPTSGSNIGATVAFNGGSILGGDNHYIKYSPELSFYYTPFTLPYLKNYPVVLEFRGSADFIRPPVPGSGLRSPSIAEWVPPEDRLVIGGPETLRGWSYYDYDLPASWRSVGMYHRILYGVELRFPIHPQMLWMAFFFDAGSVWSDISWEKQLPTAYQDVVRSDLASGQLKRIQDVTSTSWMNYFRYSYGFGFRVQIPMMPLRFWFGKKMIYADGFKTIGDFQFQFAIGDMRF